MFDENKVNTTKSSELDYLQKNSGKSNTDHKVMEVFNSVAVDFCDPIIK